jgi:hypothetical protein
MFTLNNSFLKTMLKLKLMWIFQKTVPKTKKLALQNCLLIKSEYEIEPIFKLEKH